MKKSLEERLRYAIESDKFKFEKFFGNGCKWYSYYLVVWELVWARNFCDGYKIHVYDSEYKNEHIATFTVDYVLEYNNGYYFVPRLQTYYLKENNVA